MSTVSRERDAPPRWAKCGESVADASVARRALSISFWTASGLC